MSKKRKLKKARRALTAFDAELAYWFLNDGLLSRKPLERRTQLHRELREQRLDLIDQLEDAGGKDPQPTFMQPPTDAQRDHWNQTHPILVRRGHEYAFVARQSTPEP